MNRLETAVLLEERQVKWPATPMPPDATAEVEAWAADLAAFELELVHQVVFDHVGQFGLTLSEVKERVVILARGRSRRQPARGEVVQECPTCGRSPFGPHRGVDPCRTCGRDEAPEYARMTSTRELA